jgi:hypothetical protein
MFRRKKAATVAPRPPAEGINVRANEHGFAIPDNSLIINARHYGPVSEEEQEYFDEIDRRCEAAKEEALADPTRHEYVVRACTLANPDRAEARRKFSNYTTMKSFGDKNAKPQYEDPRRMEDIMEHYFNSPKPMVLTPSQRKLYGLEGGKRKTRKSRISRKSKKSRRYNR